MQGVHIPSFDFKLKQSSSNEVPSLAIFAYLSTQHIKRSSISLMDLKIKSKDIEFPPILSLTNQISDTDLSMLEMPSMRRAVSCQENDKASADVTDLPMVLGKYIQSNYYVFFIPLNGEYFDGNHELSFRLMDDNMSSFLFHLDLPNGCHKSLSHIAYLFVSDSKVNSSELCRCYLNCLNHCMLHTHVLHLPAYESFWMYQSVLLSITYFGAFLTSIPDRNMFLKCLSRTILSREFSDSIAVFSFVGKIIELTDVPFHETNECSRLQGLYCIGSNLKQEDKILLDRLVISKSANIDYFAVARSMRMGITYLYQQDIQSPLPSFLSCIAVIPIMSKTQVAANKSSSVYQSRQDWGFSSHITRLKQDMDKFDLEVVQVARRKLTVEDFCESHNSSSMRQKYLTQSDDMLLHLRNISWSLTNQVDESNQLLPADARDRLSSHLSVVASSFGAVADVHCVLNDTTSAYLKFSSIMKRNSMASIRFNTFWSYEEYLAYNSKEQTRSTRPFVVCWGGRKGVAETTSETWQPMNAITAFNNPSSLSTLSDNFGNPITDIDGGVVYLTDTLNNAIRAVMKPNYIRTVVGISPLKQSSALTGSIGKLESVNLNSPRSVTFFTLKIGGRKLTFLVFVETNNHCVKGILLYEEGFSQTSKSTKTEANTTFVLNEVFLISKLGMDYPSGVCSYGDELIVCCRANHTLRSIKFHKKEWVVTTVGGTPGVAGDKDGKISTLSFPTECCSSSSGVYFIEQGKSAAVKHYHNSQVGTVAKGLPFKNLTSICCDNEMGHLLICDRGAPCIWSMNLADSTLQVKVSLDDMQLYYPALASFSPGAIVKVASGSFVFTDISSHQLYRFMDTTAAEAAANVAKEIYEGYENQIDEFVNVADRYLKCYLRFIEDFLNASVSLWKMKDYALSLSYQVVLEQLYLNSSHGPLSWDSLVHMLDNAPNVNSLSKFFRTIAISPDTIRSCGDSLAKYIQNYDFSSVYIDATSELSALQAIIANSPDQIAGQDLLCNVLKDQKFNFPVSTATLNLIGAYLNRQKWTQDRTIVADLRREVVRWLVRCLPENGKRSWIHYRHLDVLEGGLQAWSAILDTLALNNKRSLEYKSLEWVIRIYFDSLCIGFVTSSFSEAVVKEGNTNQDSYYQIDKALCTLQCLPQLCSDKDIPPFLLSILGNTAADVARTISVTDAINCLVSNVSVLVDDNQRVSNHAYSCIFQNVLWEMLSTHFAIVSGKVSQRMKANYDREKKNMEASVQYLKSLENLIHNPPIAELHTEVLTNDIELWCQFIRWYCLPDFYLSRGSTMWTSRITNMFDKLQVVFVKIAELAMNGTISVTILRHIVGSKHVLTAAWSALGLGSISQVDYIDSVELEIQNAFMDIKVLTQILSQICPDGPELSRIRVITNNWNSLSLNTIRKVFRLPCPATEVDIMDSKSTYAPLPHFLLSSIKWLTVATVKVDLFNTFFERHGDGTVSDENLFAVLLMWRDFYSAIINGTINSNRLENYYQLLQSKPEIKVLVQTASPLHSIVDFKPDTSSDFWLPLNDMPAAAVSTRNAIYAKVQSWQKVKTLLVGRDLVKEITNIAEFTLTTTAIQEMRHWKKTFLDFCKEIDAKGDWGSLLLNEMTSFFEKSEFFDVSILNVSPALLNAIQNSPHLIAFLRIVVNDNAFTSGIEVAMGLQEMQCPTELWDSAHCRVDEKYFSMMRNIRSYLYAFLYDYPIQLHSVASFVNLFGHMNVSMDPSNIASNIQECNNLREALIQVIQCDVDAASSSRLMKLYDPQCSSNWVCVEDTLNGTSKDKDDNIMYLEYTARFRDASTGCVAYKVQKHGLNDLFDFQSTLVLSKAADMSGNTLQETVDAFLHQLSWIRRLSDILHVLYEYGHFDFYPKYQFTISVLSSKESFVNNVEQAQTLLDGWKKRVDTMRSQYYFFNYLTTKQLLILCLRLHDLVNNADAEISENIVIQIQKVIISLIAFINPSITFKDQITVTVANVLLQGWKALSLNNLNKESLEYANDMFTPKFSKYFEGMCEVVERAFSHIPQRTRVTAISSVELDEYLVPKLNNSTVYTITTTSTAVEYSHCLTQFASRGVFPEWETCMLCSVHTTEEQVCNFIRRWFASRSMVNTLKKLFYLLEVQQLSYAVQDIVGLLLRDLMSSSVDSSCRGPLVLSCVGGKHQSPLIALYQQFSISSASLPVEVISKIFHSDDFKSHLTLEMHHGQMAGGGKSFNIRTKAATENRSYGYVAINGSLNSQKSKSDFIERFNSAMKIDSEKDLEVPPLIHIDIASSVDSKLSQVLFELCVIGVVSDYSGEIIASYPPNSVLCVELAASLYENSLSHCSIYPSVIAKPSKLSFAFSEVQLRNGMGSDFESSLFDGAMGDRHSKSNTNKTNAYERLYYVTVALNVLDHGKGTFPYIFDIEKARESLLTAVAPEAVAKVKTIFEKTTLAEKERQGEKLEQDSSFWYNELRVTSGLDIDSERSFFLVTRALFGDDGHNRPSLLNLWNLWNFVNVVYWQLQEMHHMDSPLNNACMPDEKSQLRTVTEDIRTKRKIKGEIILFVLRTAREFATRQSKVSSRQQEVIGVSLSGMTRQMFNQKWDRMTYDNDNEPCFRSACRKYYLYFRSLSRCWVIDDIIEASGNTYSYSMGRDMSSVWVSCPPWEMSNFISAVNTTVQSKSAYNGEAIRVSGCGKVPFNSSCSEMEDGTYLRQPPYDDINGQPHYIKANVENGVRRHIFWSSNRSWVIAPQCNEDEGSFASSTSLVSSRWLFIPPDREERSCSFKLIYSRENQTEMKEDNAEDDLSMFRLELLPWQDSNHECVLFNNDAHTVVFLSSHPNKMIQQLHPMLLRHLESNGINVQGSEDCVSSSSDALWKMLSSLTGVQRSAAEAHQLLGGSYCLTGDSLLKILAIVYRIKCGIPVVLLGECGCGKTMLISFLCAWLSVDLHCLDVHGGTTEEDIVQVFEKATISLEKSNNTNAYVFLDEINTCAHMGIITEAISHRSINGKRLHEGIKILAALNPYRLRPTVKHEDEDLNAGLEQVAVVSQSFSADEINLAAMMKKLVYKVHPIPPTLKDFIFDFGSLSESTEMLYISSMVAKQLSPQINEDETSMISTLVGRSQQYIRNREGDPSVVSLRDVQRTIDLLNWFRKKFSSKAGKISPLCRATVLAIAHVYSYRLPTASSRYSFWTQISAVVKSFGKVAAKINFDGLGQHGLAQNILENMQRRFVNNLVVEPGIALNQALTENLFVTIICILNAIPIFIVGKPGTSKTLAIQIIASNLQGKQSAMPLWRNFPAVYIFQYQCSPLSTSASILFQYEAAKSYQEHSQDVLTVLLLDEVGLAENSPDMPLKVLHYMLVNPPIAIVGLSNWVLDSSKMNRAVCLQRPEPSAADISYTGQNILCSSAGTAEDDTSEMPVLRRESSSSNRMQSWMMNLAFAFHSLYTKQSEYFGSNTRDFIGMRDYYSLLKQLRYLGADTSIDEKMLTYAVFRNLGGRPDAMTKILKLFSDACFGSTSINASMPPPSPIQLIRDNLASTTSRHCMILSPSDTALSLLIGCEVISLTRATVLIGSKFKEDLQELHLVQQINKVKNAMESGSVVILLHNEGMFESLYDVLNQRYVIRTDIETGKEQKLLRLALGPRSQLCPVEEGFKLIVIVDQLRAYDSLDLPLLNRFEKQVFVPEDNLSKAEREIVDRLEEWTCLVAKESDMKNACDCFCGFYSGTMSSLVLTITKYGKKIVGPSDVNRILETCKRKLYLIAFPFAILKSQLLAEVVNPSAVLGIESNFDIQLSTRYGSLSDVLAVKTELTSDSDRFLVVMTRSSVSHFHLTYERYIHNKNASQENSKIIQLALVPSERYLVNEISAFFSNFSSELRTFIVLCDPIHCDSSVIAHARFCVDREYAKCLNPPTDFKVVFLVHLPVGVKDRLRHYMVNFTYAWNYSFVDDLRESQDLNGFSTVMMLENSPTQLFTLEPAALNTIITSNMQSALAKHTFPNLEEPLAHSYIKIWKDLFLQESFMSFLCTYVRECLSQYDEPGANGFYLHTLFACSYYSLSVGSFRNSLEMSLESIVVQSLSHVLRVLDKDFNMYTLYMYAKSDDEEFNICLEQWLNLAGKLYPPELVARTCAVVHPSKISEVDTLVYNSGLHGALICGIPFSEKIIGILNHAATKSNIQHLVADQRTCDAANIEMLCNSSEKYLESIIGESALSSIKFFCRFLNNAYLRDYVSSVVNPFQHLPCEAHVLIFDFIVNNYFSSNNELGNFGVGIVHSCHWMHETLIFHTLCVMSADKGFLKELSPHSSSKWAKHVPYSIYNELSSKFSMSQKPVTAESLEKYICLQILECLEANLDACLVVDSANKDEKLQMSSLWAQHFTKVMRDLKVLVTLCLPATDSDTAPFEDTIFQENAVLGGWWGLNFVAAIIEEMALNLRIQHTSEININRTAIAVGIIRKSLKSSPLKDFDLLQFIDLCETSGLNYCDLALAYLNVVKSEHKFFKEITGKSIYSYSFVGACAALIIDADTQYKFPSMPNSHYLKKSLVSILRNAASDGSSFGVEIMNKCFAHPSKGYELIRLYLDGEEDDHLSKEELQASSTPTGLLVSCFDKLRQIEDSNRRKVGDTLISWGSSMLSELAYARKAIKAYAADVCSELSSKGHIGDININEELYQLMELDGAQMYFLKCLRYRGGNDTMLTYLKLNPSQLPAGVKPIISNDKTATICDPFTCLHGKEAYFSAQIAVSNVLAQRTDAYVSILNNWEKSVKLKFNLNLNEILAVLLAAFYVKFSPGDAENNIISWVKGKCEGLQSQAIAILVAKWIASLPGRVGRPKSELILEQLICHSALLAVEYPASWLGSFLLNPAVYKSLFIPSMPKNEMDMIIAASGHVGWYKCKNGHPYSVGNCTYPMEESYCTAVGCHAKIGGRDHVTAVGTTRIDNSSNIFSTPGYRFDANSSIGGYNETNGRLIRFVLHAVMSILGNNHGLFKFVDAPSGKLALIDLHDFVVGRVMSDYSLLKALTGLGDDDLSVGLHIVLSKWRDCLRDGTFNLTNANERDKFEEYVCQSACRPVFLISSCREFIRYQAAEFTGDLVASALSHSFGQRWKELLEMDDIESITDNALEVQFLNVQRSLWSMREPVTYHVFHRWFYLDQKRQLTYPVTHSVLSLENSLPFIKYIKDILAWHSLLFSILPSTFTREEASAATNESVILMYAPADMQQKSWQLLDNFCTAFNDSFHLVTHLYECNANPFIADDGKSVDLSGGKKCGEEGVKMTRQATINFSLPSSFHGETDAAGLCTLKLLSRLEEIHNVVVTALLTASRQGRKFEVEELYDETETTRKKNYLLRAGKTPELQLLEHKEMDTKADDDTGDAADVPVEEVKRPVTNHLTPSNVLMQRLLLYNRMTTLVPIIQACVAQNYQRGNGDLQGFDFDRVERYLISHLMPSCSPVVLQIVQFQFAGEIRKSGGLRSLQSKIRQYPLSAAVLDQIWVELDVNTRMVRLMTTVEECISFVVSAGGTAVQSLDGGMLFEDYVTKVLQISPSKWEEIRCPTISQHVRLHHLQSLYLGIEHRTGEDVLATIALRYREELEPELEKQIIAICPQIDSSIFLPALREFATEQLCTPAWPADASLKEYMCYGSEQELDSFAWFRNIPDELVLKHTYCTYRTIAANI